MVPLHDRTRRSLCRWGFLALCVAPTCAVLLWAIVPRTAVFQRAQQQAISARLGLPVTFTHMTTPRPGVTLYHALVISEAESAEPLARARLVEVGWNGRAMVLIASQPEILDSGRLACLGEAIERHMRASPPGEEIAIRFLAHEVTLHRTSGAQTFTDVRGGIEPAATGPQASVSFRLAGSSDGEPITARLLRNRQTTPPTYGFEVHTGGASLPCALVADVWPAAARLGRRSTFRGSFWGADQSDGWMGEFTGQLSGVDFDELVTSQFPHKLSGEGELTVLKAVVHGGRLHEAAGSLRGGPGIMGSSLLNAAAGMLRLPWATDPKTIESLVAHDRFGYERLAFSFALDQQGLSILGHPQDDPTRILVDRYETALLKPAAGPQPVLNLVRALAPQSELQVPGSRETDGLLTRLPIPSLMAPAGKQPLPRVRAVWLKQPATK